MIDSRPLYETLTPEQQRLDERSLVRAAIELTASHPDLADELIRIKVRYQLVMNERHERSTVS